MGETVLGARIVKSFNLEAVMRERMARVDPHASSARPTASRRAAAWRPCSPIRSPACAIAFAIFYGSWRVSVQHADVGAFASFLGALLLAYEPAKRLGRFPVDIQNGLVGARLIYEVLDAPLGDDAAAGRCRRCEVAERARRARRRPLRLSRRART